MAAQEQAGVTGESWAWWGAAAGALGIVANLVADDQGSLTDQQRRAGAAVVEQLERSTYHLGVVAGLLAVACLLIAAAGWSRWAREGGRAGVAGLSVGPALAISAAALLVGYGFRGGLAEYLPGGINDDNFPADGLYVLFVINDTAPWFGWWGVVFAAGLCAWIAFGSRLLPRWLGVLSAVAVVVPVAVMTLSGAVALAGVAGPVWLTLASAALALRGSALWRRVRS